MVNTLTWKVLSPEITHYCLAASDLPQIRAVLRSYNDKSQGALLCAAGRNPGQVHILVDLYAHLIAFAKSRMMSPEKTSTLVGIVQDLHEQSMSQSLTRVASYDYLRKLMVQHSVPRPPYSAAIFDIDDVKDFDEYMLSTYYRHYKMYAFVFVQIQRANINTYMLGEAAEKPPLNLPALSAALPQSEWKRKTEERERCKEEARMEEAFKDSIKLEEQRQRGAALNNPQYSEGIREQLEAIRNAVSTKSMDRLDLVEEKLSLIERKVEEIGMKSRPSSRKG